MSSGNGLLELILFFGYNGPNDNQCKNPLKNGIRKELVSNNLTFDPLNRIIPKGFFK
jgi:hypothetical protein